MNDTLTPSTTIDEVARRLPTFLGGEPIELANGQSFSFPKPVLEFCPRWAGSSVSAVVVTSLGKEFDEAAAAFDTACQQAGEPEYKGPTSLDAMMNLAVIMIRKNYDLTNDELSTLLRWRPDDESSEYMWTSIQDVARGVGPKPKADGSA